MTRLCPCVTAIGRIRLHKPLPCTGKHPETSVLHLVGHVLKPLAVREPHATAHLPGFALVGRPHPPCAPDLAPHLPEHSSRFERLSAMDTTRNRKQPIAVLENDRLVEGMSIGNAPRLGPRRFFSVGIFTDRLEKAAATVCRRTPDDSSDSIHPERLIDKRMKPSVRIRPVRGTEREPRERQSRILGLDRKTGFAPRRAAVIRTIGNEKTLGAVLARDPARVKASTRREPDCPRHAVIEVRGSELAKLVLTDLRRNKREIGKLFETLAVHLTHLRFVFNVLNVCAGICHVLDLPRLARLYNANQ